MFEHDDIPPADHTPWAAWGSDIGQTRTDNEDAVLCDPRRGLFVVADGMGGHAAGEQASAMAIHTLDAVLSAERLHTAIADGPDAMRVLLREALAAANAAVLQVGVDHPEWEGLGTTAVLAVLAEDKLYVANVGDSRAYLLRKSKAVVLTADHTIAAMLVNVGAMDSEDVRDNPLRNQLTMILGADQPLNPTFIATTLQPGERLLLCTDGLWDMLEDTELAGIVRYSATPREAVYSLIAEADLAGAKDNITALVIFR